MKHAKIPSFWRYLVVSKEYQPNKDVREWCKPKMILNTHKTCTNHSSQSIMYLKFVIMKSNNCSCWQSFEVENCLYSHSSFVCHSFIFGRHLWNPYVAYETMFLIPKVHQMCMYPPPNKHFGRQLQYLQVYLASCTRIFFPLNCLERMKSMGYIQEEVAG